MATQYITNETEICYECHEWVVDCICQKER